MRDYHDIIHSQIIFHICIQEICDFLKAIKLFFFITMFSILISDFRRNLFGLK